MRADGGEEGAGARSAWWAPAVNLRTSTYVLVPPSSQHSQTPAPLVEAEKGADASVKGSPRPWGLRWGVGQGGQNPAPFLEYGAAPESAAKSWQLTFGRALPPPLVSPQSRGPAPAPGPWLTSHCPWLCPGVCRAGGTQLEAGPPPSSQGSDPEWMPCTYTAGGALATPCRPCMGAPFDGAREGMLGVQEDVLGGRDWGGKFQDPSEELTGRGPPWGETDDFEFQCRFWGGGAPQ